MRLLIDAGYSWRQVFLACAGTLAALLVMNILFLKESPASIAEPEPEADPDNLFGGRGGDPVPSSIRSLLGSTALQAQGLLVGLPAVAWD